MKWKNEMKMFYCFLMAFLSPLLCNAAENIVIRCDTFNYEITPEGQNVALTDAKGTNWLKTGTTAEEKSSAYIKRGEQTIVPVGVSFDQGELKYDFGQGVKAKLRVESVKNRLVFEVVSFEGEADSLTFVNIPTKLEGVPEESFGVCALSLNLWTHVHALPALQKNLQANCYKRFQILNSKVAVIGVEPSVMLATIRDVMTLAAPDVPFSDQGGAWALSAKEGYGSYLMNFGSLTQQSVDDWIKACQTIGFNQIDNHGGSPSFYLFGSFEMDKNRFPEGWKTYAKIVDKLHKAGISSILHSYACYISPSSKYVTPVPHADLDLVSQYTLAEPLTVDATEIVVKEPISRKVLETGYKVTSNKTLKIGNEIIRYTNISDQAPYKFTGCKRGFHGTKAAAAPANEKIGLLKTFWSGLYVPRPDSALYCEVAKNHADIVNECGFDGIYFDAIEGIRWMWGEENYWYYGGKFVQEVVKNLKKPVGMEYAGMIHSWWHYRSRYQAWDKPTRGYKRFMDIHIAAMKAGEEYQHGCWLGHGDRIDRFANMKDCGLGLPLQVGWWGLHAWGGPKTEPTFGDDMEYVCCKMLGNNAGLSMTSGFDPGMIAAHPAFLDYAKLIRQYEELRHAKYFDESVLARLRESGKEFTLFKQSDGKWNFKPFETQKHKVLGLASDSAKWTVQNQYKEQPIRLRLELLTAIAEKEENATLLTNTVKKDDFTSNKTAEGVRIASSLSAEKVPATGDAAMVMTAENVKKVARSSAWAFLEKSFATPQKLSNRLAMGVWIKGDGKGEVINFQVASHPGFYGENNHLVKVDFTGWKYFELVEADSTEMSRYAWPVQRGYFVYSKYRESANYGAIDTLNIWYNNIPEGQKVECLIGPVRALATSFTKIENPTLNVNGTAIVLPVVMETGMYIELRSKTDCKLYNRDGKVVQEISLDTLPNFKKGANEISLTAKPLETGKKVRAQISVFTVGDPL